MKGEEPLSAGGRPPWGLIADQDTASELTEANEADGRPRDLLPADRRAMSDDSHSLRRNLARTEAVVRMPWTRLATS